jgi:hypothetical protein
MVIALHRRGFDAFLSHAHVDKAFVPQNASSIAEHDQSQRHLRDSQNMVGDDCFWDL